MPIQAPQWTDYLNCPVCCREFGPPPRSPISLGCGHTLCKHCLKNLHKKQCPFDQTVIQSEPEELVVNTALLLLAGCPPPEHPHHPPCIKALPEQDKKAYDSIVRCMEQLAVYLKLCGSASTSLSTNRFSRPMQRKLVTLLQCAMTDEEGRGRAARAARSLGERTVTELILQHQNPQQLSANLWAAVRARGCQFLGPAMQEEVLKLVLLALEDGSALSRKVLVMFVVQRLEPHFPQASKTSIGHVVQLLYRASCFKVSKRECDSSLMQLKDEFRTYEALRREHDAQIVQIATEAGLRIAPDQWSALLYGDSAHKSHMQSIIDKLQTPQSFAQSVQELFIALQRTADPAHLVLLSAHLDRLANIDSSPDAKSPSWQQLAEVVTSVKEVVSGLIHYVQQAHARDSGGNPKVSVLDRCDEQSNTAHTLAHLGCKVPICRESPFRIFCPYGDECTYIHFDEELNRIQALMNTNSDMTNGNMYTPGSMNQGRHGGRSFPAQQPNASQRERVTNGNRYPNPPPNMSSDRGVLFAYPPPTSTVERRPVNRNLFPYPPQPTAEPGVWNVQPMLYPPPTSAAEQGAHSMNNGKHYSHMPPTSAAEQGAHSMNNGKHYSHMPPTSAAEQGAHSMNNGKHYSHMPPTSAAEQGAHSMNNGKHYSHMPPTSAAEQGAHSMNNGKHYSHMPPTSAAEQGAHSMNNGKHYSHMPPTSAAEQGAHSMNNGKHYSHMPPTSAAEQGAHSMNNGKHYSHMPPTSAAEQGAHSMNNGKHYSHMPPTSAAEQGAHSMNNGKHYSHMPPTSAAEQGAHSMNNGKHYSHMPPTSAAEQGAHSMNNGKHYSHMPPTSAAEQGAHSMNNGKHYSHMPPTSAAEQGAQLMKNAKPYPHMPPTSAPEQSLFISNKCAFPPPGRGLESGASNRSLFAYPRPGSNSEPEASNGNLFSYSRLGASSEPGAMHGGSVFTHSRPGASSEPRASNESIFFYTRPGASSEPGASNGNMFYPPLGGQASYSSLPQNIPHAPSQHAPNCFSLPTNSQAMSQQAMPSSPNPQDAPVQQYPSADYASENHANYHASLPYDSLLLFMHIHEDSHDPTRGTATSLISRLISHGIKTDSVIIRKLFDLLYFVCCVIAVYDLT
ncbi:roquin-1-like [Battus philenor]|uniref:roquin-1-like n=1 Tax=Battus philenor TaxID=42288 RepID=UPI0035CEBAA1